MDAADPTVSFGLTEESANHVVGIINASFTDLLALYARYFQDLLGRARLGARIDTLPAVEQFYSLAVPAYPDYDTIDRLFKYFDAHPGTAELVKELHVLVEPQSKDRGVRPEPEIMQYMLAIADLDLTPELVARIHNGVRLRHEDAELAMLFCKCRKLQVLSFTAAYFPDQGILAQILNELASARAGAAGKASVSAHPLLHEINFAHEDTEEFTSISTLTGFLRLPELRIFRCYGVDLVEEDEDANVELVHLPSQIQEISLREPVVDGPGLERLLRAAPHLQILDVVCGSHTISCPDFSFRSIGPFLTSHAHNLRKLKFDHEYSEVSEADDRGQPISSLKSLEVLEHLTLPFDGLFGDDEFSIDPDVGGAEDHLVDLLPHSLQTLRILRANGDGDPELRDRQLEGLMHDEAYKALHTIRINRSEAFSLDLQESEWNVMPESSRWWQVLKRRVARV
ncbi:hypothetical protein MRB53_038024 [Persea americana]|nr:hypothetical protein MRB53_038024 [Persea americana]